MADENIDESAAPDDAADGPGDPRINIHAQYTKDLSFENPLGPNSQGAAQMNPEVSVEIHTKARPLPEGGHEVTLFIRGEAKNKDATLFIVELTYGAVFTLENVPEDTVGPALLIEGARLLFPFARNIVADATRDGGFPPLLINPVNFVQLYQERHVGAADGEADAEDEA